MSSVPYIGAKISLISKSEIRYEGILAEVDPKESTIGLENVTMMGTENRKPGHEFIPMNNQMYDYILFRSSDIKDLQVCEAPSVPSPPPPPQMSFVDPAIVQSSNANGSSYYPPMVQQSQQTYGAGAWMGQQQPKLQFGSGGAHFSSAQGYPSYAGGLQFGNSPSYYSAQQQPMQDNSFYTQQQAPPHSEQYQEYRKETVEPSHAKMSSALQSKESGVGKVHPETAANIVSLTPKMDKKEGTAAATTMKKSEEPSKVLSYSTETKKMQLVDRQPNISYASMVSQGKGEQRRKSMDRPGSFRLPHPGQQQGRQMMDFKFENSQAGQQNLSNAQAEVLRAIQDRTFYKKSSFFDDISCDSKDGSADDTKLRNERNWNVETFGVPAPPGGYYHGHHHRGRGGHRGRGSYRGGRGGAVQTKS